MNGFDHLPRDPGIYMHEPPWEELAEVTDTAGAHPLERFLIDWPAFWTDEDQQHDWLLEPLFAAGRGHAIYAQAKTGKSWVVLAACAALATGRPFLGHPGGTPTDVLYVDYEMTAADVRDRLYDFDYGPEVDLSHFHYALLPSIGPLDSDIGGMDLAESALALGVSLVVIDTTGRAVAGDENDADTFRNFYRHTGARLKQAGIAFVRIDHAGKQADKGQRGSSAKNDDVDVVVRLTNLDDGKRWTATHRRMSWYPEQTDIEVKSGQRGYSFATEQRGYKEGTSECVADLESLGVPLDATLAAAQAALKGADKGRRRQVVADALRFRRESATDPLEDF